MRYRFPGALLLLLSLSPAVPFRLAAQTTPVRVLVAPLAPAVGVNGEFGERVADEVWKGLDRLDGVEPLERRMVENALKVFRAQARVVALTPIHWRQLGGQLDAEWVMIGSTAASGEGVRVQALFLQPWWGDELPLPEIAVPDDGGSGAREVAAGVVAGFEGQLGYLESLRQCEQLLDADQFGDALASCDQALSLRQDGMEAFYSRGRAFSGLERWEEAVADLETTLSAGPRLSIGVAARAIRGLAYGRLRLDDAEGATRLYRQYLQLGPEDVDRRLSIARILYEAGAAVAAVRIVEDGLAIDPENPRLTAFLDDPATSVAAAAIPEQRACPAWALEIRSREDTEVEVYRFLGDEVVPVREAAARGSQGLLLRVIRANGTETLPLAEPNPILMLYRFQPFQPAVRETVVRNGVLTIQTVAPAQPESRTLIALVSPSEVEPHDLRTVDVQFSCDPN